MIGFLGHVKYFFSQAKTWGRSLGLVIAAMFLFTSCSLSTTLDFNPWEVMELPSDSMVLDMSFISPKHGWLVGSNATLMETLDGGRSWQPRTLALDTGEYRFNSISFSGQEGWIVGEPTILLHTTDGGQSWSEIPLSAKLPGDPNTIYALGPSRAEMTTNIGAIYQTQDGGKTWKALVQEAVGVVRNISRSPQGEYVAVSSRGSFYSTWKPGQAAWEPHNRNSSRRVQNMGFGEDGQLWMLVNGGNLSFNDITDPETWSDPVSPQGRNSVGLLDLAFRTPQEAWLSGGSGSLLCSLDGGKTWKKDRDVANVPSNFYKILFFSPSQGFIIGQQGILLRYVGDVQSTAFTKSDFIAALPL